MILEGQTNRVDRRKFLGRAAALAGVAMVIPAFTRGSSVLAQDATYPEVVYSGKEYAFSGPPSIAGGLVKLTLQNDGAMQHHMMLLRFSDGKSMADLGEAMKQGLAGLPTLGVAVGGPGSVDGGGKSSVIMDLAAGNYVAMCLIPDADGVPHAAKGMVMPITVTAAATPAASEPTASATVGLTEFHFTDLPTTAAAGTVVWKVTNTGAQLHEMGLAMLGAGVSFDQVKVMLSGSEATPMPGMSTPASGGMESSPAAGGPPFMAIGGAAPMDPGQSVWYTADLTAGNYFAICFVPDSKTGAPHFVLGMIMPFTVA